MTRVADGVLGKLARQLFDVFRRVREGSLPVERVQRAIKQLLGTLLVPFDPSRSWGDAVEAGKYDNAYIAPDFNPALHLPPITDGQREIEVALRKQDKTTTTGQWLNLLDDSRESGQRFAHPLVVLAIGEHEPNEQRDAPIFTVWHDANGQLWYLVLHEDAGSRGLLVRRGRPDDRWRAYDRAAAVAV